MTLELPWALLGMRFGLDGTTRVFLGFTLALWLLAALHAAGYVRERRRAFAAFFAATFVGNLGLILARDAASFYLFFALMTFAAYGLVVFEGGAAARRAGHVYIVLAVIGEALLLGGLLLAAGGAESLELAHMRAAAAASPQRGLIVALLVAGFGVKAGLPGLHLWLPLAHPVAPTPASAVLSGAMIKAGLLGWLAFLPLGEAAMPGAGAALAALGLAAVFAGALYGALQDEPKTVLAYSSISQMGFMTLAVGAALAHPASAPAAAAAAAGYALHHGLAKGALFLGVAVRSGVALRVALLALPGLALAGVPYTSGAAAKHALKALLEPWPAAAALLPFAAAATALVMARFLMLAAGAPAGRTHPLVAGAWLAAVAASLLAVMALDAAPFSAGDLWPVLAGAALAALLAARGARLPRVPPGDLLALVELAARGAGPRLARLVGELDARGRRVLQAMLRLQRSVLARLGAAGASGERWLRGEGLKAAALVLALLLALELMR